MFQFRRFPTYDYFIHRMLTEFYSARLPHSEIHGSMPAFGSPWLIVDRYVLRRLPVPRHSPCALCSLTMCSLLGIRNEFCSYFSLQRINLNFFSLLWNCSYYPKQLFGSLDLLNNSLVNNSFLAFLSASLYSVFKVHFCGLLRLVGLSGLEPPTSRLSGVRSNRLSYKPISS